MQNVEQWAAIRLDDGWLHDTSVTEIAVVKMTYNKPLVPTRKGEAPLLAAQRR